MRSKFNPLRFRRARQAAGKSLSDSAAITNTSRQFIHQIEVGTKQPPEAILFALASAFSVDVDFFYLTMENIIDVTEGHFRKLQKTPVAITQQAIGFASLFEEFIDLLSQSVEFPDPQFPNVACESVADAEAAATILRREWCIEPNKPISSLTGLLEAHGIFVTSFQSVSGDIDAFSMNRGYPVIIRNDTKGSVFRQRFDLAHELGHIVLHHGMQTGDHETESQANRFASALLLPSAAFINEFRRSSRLSWDSMYAMKLHWGVSVAAIIRRAYDLALIDDREYRSAYAHLGNIGQRKTEIYDQDYPLEKSTLIPSALSIIDPDIQVAIQNCSKELKVAPKLLASILADVSRDLDADSLENSHSPDTNVVDLHSIKRSRAAK